ncbi:MAG TPA: hypothetical protein VK395_23035 [Gemmataceae bacterium]|nr:hypothetical protein [Gemmataceae bacterium]
MSDEEFLEREQEDGALNMWMDVLVRRRALPEQVALTILVSDKAFAEGDKGRRLIPFGTSPSPRAART